MIEALEPRARRAQTTWRLARREPIGELYHVLTFELEGASITARAGQFAMIRGAAWGSAPLLPRPMSLLSAAERPSMLIKVVGDGTRRMALASAGEAFDVLAPLGIAWRAPLEGHRAVLVSGGVGVAPLLFFANELAARAAQEPLALYGGRSSRDLPLAAELAAVAELRVATEDGSRGEAGRVTALLDAELARAPAPIHVFSCGPEPMMAAVAQRCEAAGVPCDVSLETPMACGYGVCLGCPVPRRSGGYLYACTEGPCIDASRIDLLREIKR